MAIPADRILIFVYEPAPGFRALARGDAARRFPGVQCVERNAVLHNARECETDHVRAVYVEQRFAHVHEDYRGRGFTVFTEGDFANGAPEGSTTDPAERPADSEESGPAYPARKRGRPRKLGGPGDGLDARHQAHESVDDLSV